MEKHHPLLFAERVVAARELLFHMRPAVAVLRGHSQIGLVIAGRASHLRW